MLGRGCTFIWECMSLRVYENTNMSDNLNVCMCMCVHVNLNLSVYIWVYKCTYVNYCRRDCFLDWVRVFLGGSVCAAVCFYMCVSVRALVHASTCIRVCEFECDGICVYMCVSMSVCRTGMVQFSLTERQSPTRIIWWHKCWPWLEFPFYDFIASFNGLNSNMRRGIWEVKEKKKAITSITIKSNCLRKRNRKAVNGPGDSQKSQIKQESGKRLSIRKLALKWRVQIPAGKVWFHISPIARV